MKNRKNALSRKRIHYHFKPETTEVMRSANQ